MRGKTNTRLYPSLHLRFGGGGEISRMLERRSQVSLESSVSSTQHTHHLTVLLSGSTEVRHHREVSSSDCTHSCTKLTRFESWKI